MKNVFKLAAVSAAFTLFTHTTNAADKIGFVDPTYVLQNHPAMIEAGQRIEQIAAEIKKKFETEEQKLADEDKALGEEFKKIEEEAKKLHQEQSKVENSIKKKMAALDKEAPKLRAKEIQARRNAIQAEQKAFQAKVDALQKKDNDLRAKTEAFQNKVSEFQQKVAKEQKENSFDTTAVQKIAIEDVNAAIKMVADQRGYTVVLQTSNALYAKDDKSADLTDAVLNEIKAKAKPAQAK